MLKTTLLCGGSALAAAATLCASGAFAATAEASASSAAASAATVGELTVIAQKREQSIETVPVAISAFSAEQRKLIGIQIVQDLADFSPSVNWTDVDDRIYIRGIGRNSDNLNNTSGVAIYYNGVYYGANASVEQQKDDLFIGNIEVDNGPQNTLHGSNADGGIVQFTSKRPTDTWYAEARAGAANYNTYFGEAVVSGPINDHLKFRLGGNYTSQRGGFFNNLDGPPQGGNLVLGGGGQTEYVEGQLEGHWDKLDVWFLASSADFAANTHGVAGIGFFPLTPFTTANGLTPSGFYALCALPGVAASPNGVGCGTGPTIVPGSVVTRQFTANQFPGNNPGNLNPRDFINEDNGKNDMQGQVQLTGQVTYHAPSVDITYLGGYQNFHYVLHIPNQAVAGLDSGVVSFQEEGPPGAGNLTIFPTPDYLIFNEYDQSFSHEIDFTSTWQSKFNYVAGLYWYRERWNQPVDADTTPGQPQMLHPAYFNFLSTLGGTACPAGTPLFGFCAAPVNPTMAGSSELTAITYNSYAAFAQASYKFNDQWKVTGALRYTSDHKAGFQTWRVVSFDNIVTASAAGAATPALDITALAACNSDGAKLGVCEPAYPGAGPTTMNPVTGNAYRNLSATWGALTGEFDVDWTPDPTTLVYAKYSRGYKSGGWSTYTIGALPEVNPEYVDALEAGAKKTIGRTWTLNGDVFYYSYKGEQVPLSVVNNIGQIVPILYNLPKVRTYGVELWGSWHPIDPFIASLSYSYLNATIRKSACVLDTVDPLAIQPGANTAGCSVPHTQNIVGEQIPGATPNKLTLNGIYTFSFDPGKLALSGTFVYRDGTYDDVFNRWYTFQPSSIQVNLRATWTGADNRYNIILFCNNLFNSNAYDGNGGSLLGTTGAGTPAAHEYILMTPALNAPRTFGIQVQYRWQ